MQQSEWCTGGSGAMLSVLFKAIVHYICCQKNNAAENVYVTGQINLQIHPYDWHCFFCILLGAFNLFIPKDYQLRHCVSRKALQYPLLPSL